MALSLNCWRKKDDKEQMKIKSTWLLSLFLQSTQLHEESQNTLELKHSQYNFTHFDCLQLQLLLIGGRFAECSEVS